MNALKITVAAAAATVAIAGSALAGSLPAGGPVATPFTSTIVITPSSGERTGFPSFFVITRVNGGFTFTLR